MLTSVGDFDPWPWPEPWGSFRGYSQTVSRACSLSIKVWSRLSLAWSDFDIGFCPATTAFRSAADTSPSKRTSAFNCNRLPPNDHWGAKLNQLKAADSI